MEVRQDFKTWTLLYSAGDPSDLWIFSFFPRATSLSHFVVQQCGKGLEDKEKSNLSLKFVFLVKGEMQ